MVITLSSSKLSSKSYFNRQSIGQKSWQTNLFGSRAKQLKVWSKHLRLIFIDKQGYSQMRTPAFNQENIKSLENKPTFSKNIFQLCPSGSLKAAISAKMTEPIQPSTVPNKYRIPKHKTQQNSPMNQRTNSNNTLRFPTLPFGGNTAPSGSTLLKYNHGQIEHDPAKTSIIMDSLMRFLKNGSEPRQHFRQQKRVINLTSQSNEFTQCQKTKRSCKKPKIVKNQITKKFFEGNIEKERKICSEDRCRKVNNSSLINEKMGEYTFYGGSVHTLKIQTEGPIPTKNELNEMRIHKLSKKRFDFK